GLIKIEQQISLMRLGRDENGEPLVAGQFHYHRLVINDVLWGSQGKKLDKHVVDYFQLFTFNSWENVVVAGALQDFDFSQEPLTYYHRSGPVGAIFRELHSRKLGADRKAPVAKFGLDAGTICCYAIPGQRFTFYEADPTLARLVAERDKYFT